jgi:hypothetical protein
MDDGGSWLQTVSRLLSVQNGRVRSERPRVCGSSIVIVGSTRLPTGRLYCYGTWKTFMKRYVDAVALDDDRIKAARERTGAKCQICTV